LKFDFSLVTPIAGAITALPLVAVFAIGLAITTPQSAIALAIGANLIAIASLVGAPRLSLRLAITDALVMGLSVFVGTITSPIEWLHVAVLVPWCFVAGMLVVFGQTQATVGAQAIVAFVVLGRFAGSPSTALHLSFFVVVGAFVEVLALLVLRLPPTLRYQRGRLANSFDAVGELARSDPRRPATDLLGILDGAQRALSATSLFSRTDVQDLRAILDQARRIRLELTTLAGLRIRLTSEGEDPSNGVIDVSLAEAAMILETIAQALRHAPKGSDWKLDTSAFDQAVAPLASKYDDQESGIGVLARQCASHLIAIGGQLRSTGSLLEHLHEGDNHQAWHPSIPAPHGPDFGRLRNDWATFRANLRLDSSAFRHGVRLAIAVPASILIGTLLSLPRSYWLPFAVAVILKPDYSTLVKRGLGRVIGTMIGATLAAVVVSELHPSLAITVVLVAIVGWLAYSSWAASFSVAIGFVTAMVLILLSTSTTDALGTAGDRLIDISLGGAIAVITYIVWPTSPRAGVAQAQSELFFALRDYLSAVVDLVESKAISNETIAECSRRVRVAWAKAEAAVGRSVEEPAATRIDPSEGRSLLTTTMRMLRAIHALRIEAERGSTVVQFEEFEALKGGALSALEDLGRWFLLESPSPPVSLRPLYRATEKRLSTVGAPVSIASHLDELVNALNTATHLSKMVPDDHMS
jgi:uncharacterized membrane protein YccC